MILLTYPHSVPNELKIIHSLLEAGLETLHVRKPDFTAAQMRDFITLIDAAFHARIMIHSHYELCYDMQLKGIHITEKKKPQWNEYQHYTCNKSMATHALDALDNVPKEIDYILLSPIFPSVSKIGYSTTWDYDLMKQKLHSPLPYRTVALGGITLENIDKVKALGFNDFALLGSIWEKVKSGYTEPQILEIFNRFSQ